MALFSDRSFRQRDALSNLLERFEAGGFHVVMWHLEQATRRPSYEAWSLHHCDIDDLKNRSSEATKHLIERALGQNFDSDRAAMHEFYFFTLRVHEWLASTPLRAARKTRLVNDTFGYQLLSTLLDHRIIAIRMRANSKPDAYYAIQYGCLDRACRDLVEKLADEFLSAERTWKPHEEIRKPLLMKRRATDERLATLN